MIMFVVYTVFLALNMDSVTCREYDTQCTKRDLKGYLSTRPGIATTQALS